MKRSLIAGATLMSLLALTDIAVAQTYFVPQWVVPIAAASPQSTPTEPRHLALRADTRSGTALPTLAMSDCGAANPLGGRLSMASGNCP